MSRPVTSFASISPEKVQHLAVGEPESVPAGRYAKETLQHLNLWDSLQNKFVFTNDVRQVLTYVESGNADLGVVYSSDVVVAKNVRVIDTAKAGWHNPIIYPGAIVSASRHSAEARAFLDFLTGSAGREVLKKYGF